mmetsp:Transcript_9245/g.21791  ORF Transcript_9245/g.21791 Transcript_9245/m.21791 type:complete len:555 (+) Transcript_9245:178-1842(+)|eukprot:CAMPEP_0185800030 /NCGR_PEP_ID=MMETSP1322-20130828/654_1 /TAXON_ID=265543 /ORGANISM="Minutocellus polymorphus, Strain RCC2270" /LENGTH=554 /DNA_ID=CAMNT_0028495643 /DNA_START=176 /DNA_END=1843 /DNA_ORIENTATION=+
MAQSMNLNAAAGLSGMLKSGHKHLSGPDATVVRNVEAARDLSRIVSTSLGPNGMNKLVVNHLERIIVTSDCAAIVRELEIEHPAAKMLSMASDAQDKECGDGTNLTVSFAGELLGQTEDLLRMGLHPSEIVEGYKKAGERLLELLPALAVETVDDPRDRNSLLSVVSPVLSAKQYGSEDVLAPLVVDACLGTMGSSSSSGRPSVNPDSVRVSKILGSNVAESRVIRGFVALRGSESTVTSAADAKITIFGCGIEASGTEAKGTVLMKNADDLKGYNKSEEKRMEETIKAIADTGCKVVLSGGTVSEMALHFIERYGLMCLRCPSKFDLRRLCTASGATALVRLGPATPDEMGHCDSVRVEEVGGRKVTIFSQDEAGGDGGCRLSTILLRASTSSTLADLERAIDDGVHAAKMACRDGRLVPGAGATEMELSVQIKNYADTCPGLDQYAVRAFARALEVVPRTLAENAGLDGSAVLAALGAAHANGNAMAGVDIEAAETGRNGVDEATAVRDLLNTKSNAFRLAIDAALTVLRVDQIIMSKPAGGGQKDARMGQV